MESEYYYWCFICKKGCNVMEENDGLHCEFCNSTFVEEIDRLERDRPENFIPENRQNHQNSSQSNLGSRNSVGSFSIQLITGLNGGIIHSNFGSNQNQFTTQTFSNNNSNNFFSNFLQGFMGTDTTNFLGRHTNDLPFENLLNFLMMNDPNRYGNPPASKKILESIKIDKLTDNSSEIKNQSNCLVCLEDFQVEESVIKLDCKHCFHDNCLKDWLNKHNTCPVCRLELETDDIDYENRKKANRNTLRNLNPNN